MQKLNITFKDTTTIGNHGADNAKLLAMVANAKGPVVIDIPKVGKVTLNGGNQYQAWASKQCYAFASVTGKTLAVKVA